MRITRRDFIKNSLILGGSILFSPLSPHAVAKKETDWQPAYAGLESEGRFASKIEEAYAISAGREVQVIVKPEEVMESEMVNLAHKISREIHQQIKNFPGEIKINVIRETHATAYTTAGTE